MSKVLTEKEQLVIDTVNLIMGNVYDNKSLIIALIKAEIERKSIKEIKQLMEEL
jgi:hypothetical protein